VLALADGSINNPIFTEGPDALSAAAQAISNGTERVIDLRVAVGRNEEKLAVRQDTLRAESAILGETFNALTARLEASYLLTSRLSNLSLLNFIR